MHHGADQEIFVGAPGRVKATLQTKIVLRIRTSTSHVAHI